MLLELGSKQISEGTLVNIYQRTSDKARGLAEEICGNMVKQKVIASDETGFRVDGNNGFHWVFKTMEDIVHVLTDTRSRSVIMDLLGEKVPEVWVSDAYSGQQSIAPRHQTCLAHLRRKAKLVLVHGDAVIGFALTGWLEKAFDLADGMSSYKPATIKSMRRELDRKMCDIIYQDTDCDVARKVLTAFRNVHEKNQLLTFADYPAGEVPTNNNECERALRHSVIMRKVIYGFRSWWAVEGYADLLTVIDTGRLKGTSPLQSIQRLLQ